MFRKISKSRSLASVIALATIFAALASYGASQSGGAASTRLEVQFFNHLQGNMNEQHVFIEKTADSAEVYRVTAELVGVLESVLEREPYHPGATHYYIHAMEDEVNTLIVPSTAVGNFGNLSGGLEPDVDGQPGYTVQGMVYAGTLREDDRVWITATGELVLNTADPPSSTTDPDGIVFTRPLVDLAPPGVIFPLDEAAWRAGEPLRPVIDDLGALMAACVPHDDDLRGDGERDDSVPPFSPYSDDPFIHQALADLFLSLLGLEVPSEPQIVGDIPATELFKVGSSHELFVEHDCDLFLGINDAYTANNSGQFEVEIKVLDD